MPHEVIMPALGMAQDTGLIVAWHKAAGETVAAEEVLFEVETDKTTMEVPAGASGFVAALLAGAGEEVPVGEVIAVISAEKPDSPEAVTRQGKPAPVAEQAAVPATAPATAPAMAPVEKPAAPAAAAPVPAPAVASAGRILASPKAKRLAAEQGLDLARLVPAGVPMPYHVADLESLRALPATRSIAAAGAMASSLHISARVPQAGFTAFLEAVGTRAGVSAILAAFAAASLRAARGAHSALILLERPLSGEAEAYRDPDLGPISAAVASPASEGTSPDLILRDLTGSRITGGSFGTEGPPTLTIAADADSFALSLDFTPQSFTPENPGGNPGAEPAIRLLDGFAGRLEDPLRHLL